MRGFIVVFAVLAACGSDSKKASVEEQLEGQWGVEYSNIGCVGSQVFSGDEYESDLICELDNGSIGVQADVGTFAVSGSTMTFMPMASSCHEQSAEPYDVLFKLLDDDTLRITTPEAVIVLKRVKQSGGGDSASAVYGCYDTDGTFTPAKVQQL